MLFFRFQSVRSSVVLCDQKCGSDPQNYDSVSRCHYTCIFCNVGILRTAINTDSDEEDRDISGDPMHHARKRTDEAKTNVPKQKSYDLLQDLSACGAAV